MKDEVSKIFTRLEILIKVAKIFTKVATFLRKIFNALWSYFNFPSFIYHEFCHVVAMCLLFPFITIQWNKATLNITYKEGVLNWDCKFEFKTYNDILGDICALIICSAPVTGWLIGGVTLFYYDYMLWTYFAGAIVLNMSFLMSQTDKKTFEKNWILLHLHLLQSKRNKRKV